MSTSIYHGVVKGRIVELLDAPAVLLDGTKVLVTPLPAEAGTPLALLAAMEAEPHLSEADVEALEAAIAQGRRPRSRVEPFPESDTEEGEGASRDRVFRS